MSILSKILSSLNRVGLEIRNNTPVGMLMPYSGKIIPTGWLLCDGSLISRTQYSRLFTAIGTLYGEGDGSTTFSLPDYRDKTIWGGVSADVGNEKDAGLPNITGELTCPSSATTMSGGEWYAASITQTGALKTTSYTHNKALTEASYTGGQSMKKLSFDASSSNAIYGNSETVQPPAIVALMLIKY